jgi:predicted  nucleic acid-binding Zn-ribbon protein
MTSTAEAVVSAGEASEQKQWATVVSVLRQAYRRYCDLVPQMNSLRKSIKDAREPFAAKAEPYRATVKEAASKLAKLTSQSPAEDFKTALLTISDARASLKAIQKEYVAATQAFRDELKDVRKQISAIDVQMPTLLNDAFVKSLIGA